MAIVCMSFESKILKSVSWTAFFSFFSQVFSWIITILIARILVPGDYGLMSIATVITGYAEIFSELGLGNAVIQRLNVTRNELSSVFWFLMGFTMLLAAACYPISFLTASIMHEPRVIPLTQTIAIVFFFTGFQIIPSSLLRKEMKFKALAIIDMNCVILSCIGMLAIAKAGGGAWALIGGQLIRAVLRTFFLFQKVQFDGVKWRPMFHFNFKESKPYLSFGLIVALGRSLFYIQENADRFFAGRAWTANLLGYYTFALTLAQIPTFKITSLINTISYPAFSKLQHDSQAFNKLYLNITKATMMVVLPLFMGGFFLGDEIIRFFLDDKWLPMITLFKLLCLSQIIVSLGAVNSFVHTSQGRPKWTLVRNVICTIAMIVSFYFAVKHGLNAIALPWLTTNAVLNAGWIWVTNWKIGIKFSDYLSNLSMPFFATVIMSVGVFLANKQVFFTFLPGKLPLLFTVIIATLIGMLLYGLFFWIFDRRFLLNIKKLLKKSE
jgi:O-antigen/teichoic acid export membrane protein